MNTLTYLNDWARGRDARWIARRATTLAREYGVRPDRAKRRVLACVELLERFGAAATFATPGRVVEAEPEFFRELADRGVEIAVHGYDHVDFRALTADAARAQFDKATRAFARARIPVSGFRCPYLSFDDDVADAVPKRTFSYSSNMAIRWDVPLPPAESNGAGMAAQLASFYRPRLSTEVVSRPRTLRGHLEIPVTLPDDFELQHALVLGAARIRRIWVEIFRDTYRRGELFAPLFHPEAFRYCAPAFEQLLAEATACLQPAVWVARLTDIASWWRRRMTSRIVMTPESRGLRVEIRCPDDATVLERGLDGRERARWHGSDAILTERTVMLDGNLLPCVGVSQSTPFRVVEILRDEGYHVETGPSAERCAVWIRPESGVDLDDELQLLAFVDRCQGPLVRIWRWPDSARSAVAIAGDLDALSLMDYVSRLRAG
jgi:hypothetical protein